MRHELEGHGPDAYFALFWQFCGVAAGAMTRKVRKESKKVIFWCFQVRKIDIFARNGRNRSKMNEVRLGPYQIDPRGSHGAKNSAIRSYCRGQHIDNPGFLGFAT